MRKRLSKILVTGGAGFIGSEFVRLAVQRSYKVIVVDKLTYAGDLKRLGNIKGKYNFYKTDIRNKNEIASIFNKEKPDVIVHFAAETHVDRSIQDASQFIETNIIGTHTLLEASKDFGIKRFIHISTDEVYGEIKKGKFSENSLLNPGNPYSASKVSSDLFVKAYIKTYKFPAIIVRPSNNYGPWQYPEKLIPVVIFKASHNEKVPVYGRGLNRREWLYVKDCAEGILTVLKKGAIAETYNLGSGEESPNIDTVGKILKVLGKRNDLIQFVKDRPGHDYRYALDYYKIRKLGWRPKVDLEKGIKETVEWYQQNTAWLENKVKMLRKYWESVYVS